ncbi:hypothetical protein COU19_02655 [Candidatus Kaiserbacteria bacterium CG10_big_fil_rev_8_21_14_0_10_56_12]|uniref:DUF3298 domain-containing protein n=1 Tax=Candidatus Kaiserbacteria bacterium CG10_big_fil_rev_8_21_14_0_10_56_12 TaxID=1974611 RepID=A0A2H0U9F2_9BACT|nr:MAG: hypothetical protein COU19_02655 [Candidatus Kaiserbacteria bacterium CG10_big_fil_rev_8_21_14_0_10_56_12]
MPIGRKGTFLLVVGLLVVVAVLAAILLRPYAVRVPLESAPTGSVVDHATYYDIDASYPTVTPLADSVGREADRAAITQMRSYVDEAVAEFKQEGNFDHLTPEDIHLMGFDQGRKETLRISYFSASSTPTVSYIFNLYVDTLGAHGNSTFHTFTYDLKSGAALGLEDLFVAHADYLGTLSRLSSARLPDILGNDSYDTSMVDMGTAPIEANFENFFLDGTSLVLLFPPYAVAPYSAGSQTLAIPVSELRTLLKPTYQ